MSHPVNAMPDYQSRNPRFCSLDEWLAWQETLHFSEIDLGLDRCGRVADKMHLLDTPFKVITIAGTNGKGSCARMLELILNENGVRTGCYTSPHLCRYNERIRINGIESEDHHICEAFEKIDHYRKGESLTYFEFGTLAALDIFKQNEIDMAILEVGLGGRLDAVNLIDADYALLTSIDLDHQKWLGNDREAIGYEKAGVFREGIPVVCADLNPPQSVLDFARSLDTRLHLAGKDFQHQIDQEDWTWTGGSHSYSRLPFPDPYNKVQVENASAVVQMIEIISHSIPVRQEALRKGLTDFHLQGRCQVLKGPPCIVMDVAHNLESIKSFGACLDNMPAVSKNHLLIGMMEDKISEQILYALKDYADIWYVAELDTARARDPVDIIAMLRAMGIDKQHIQTGNVANMLELALAHADSNDRINITGSFITVAEAINYLN